MPEVIGNTAAGKSPSGMYAPIPPVRVRVEDFEDCFLTIKLKKKPGVNLDIKNEIPRDFAALLLKYRKSHKIRKTRYYIGKLELDIFPCGIGRPGYAGIREKIQKRHS